MKKQLLLMSACVLAYSSVSLAQEIPADTLTLPTGDETTAAAEQLPAVAEPTTPAASEEAAAPIADPVTAEPAAEIATPAAEEVATSAADMPAPVATEATTEPTPAADTQKSFADTWVELLKQARSSGKIQPDGTFNILEDGFKLTGKLLCSDEEVESSLKVIGQIFSTPDFNDEEVLSSLNKSLKCVSFSGIEFQDAKTTASFKGEFLYPAFKDGSAATAKANGRNFNTQFSLDDTQQTVDLTVTNDKDEKLFVFKMQYDAEKLGHLFEIGFLAGLISSSDDTVDPATFDKVQAMAGKYAAKSFDVAHLLKMASYRPNGDPVFTVTGDTDDHFDAAAFSSTNRKYITAKWDGTTFNFNLDYPQTDRRFVSAKVTMPADFRQKYLNFVQSMAQNNGVADPAETVGQMLSGMKKEITLYGMNNKSLAELNVSFNDTIHLTTAAAPTPQDVINTATLTINKDDGVCPIQSITFDKAKPETVAVCGNNGCKDEVIATLDQTLLPQMMACFGEVPMMATQFMEEMKGELATLEHVYIPGFTEGYTTAMNRYKINEIMNLSSQVAIVGMSKNDGMGGDATLADLGGVAATVGENLKTAITQDSDISANKDGVVTIRLAPDAAPDLMPLLANMADMAGRRVVSGCTADTTTCVIKLGQF